MTYFKALSRCWLEYIGTKAVEKRGVRRSKCCVRYSNRVPHDYKFGALPLYKFPFVNNNRH